MADRDNTIIGDLTVDGNLRVVGNVYSEQLTRTVTVAEESRVVGVLTRSDVISFLADFTSDDALTAAEKQEVYRQYRIIYVEKPSLISRLSAAGYTAGNAYVDALDDAYDVLTYWLFTDPGPLSDLTTTSAIEGDTMLGLFEDYYDAREAAIAFIESISNDGNVSLTISGASLPATGMSLDGTADDVQVNAAITAVSTAGGGTVYLPAGTLNCSGTIYLKDSVSLVGAGSREGGTIINSTVSNDAAINIEDVSSGELKQFTLQHSGTHIAYTGAIEGGGSIDVLIENIKIDCLETAKSAGIHLVHSGSTIQEAARNITIQRCEITGFQTYGIYLSDKPNNANIINNYIHGGIGIGILLSAGSVDGYDVNENILSSNTIEALYSTVGWSAWGISCSTKAQILNNNIRNLVSAVENNAAGIYVSTASGEDGENIIIVNGNTIDGCVPFLGTGFTSSFGVYISGAGIAVTSNIIKNCGLAINAVYADDPSVSNNTCVNNGQLIDRGGCESTTPPMLFGETVVSGTGGTYQQTANPYTGSNSWELISAGSGYCYRRLTDNGTDGDMHGFVPGIEYTITFMAKVAATMSADEAHFDFYYTVGSTGTSTSVQINTSNWTEYKITVQIPADATRCAPYLDLAATTANGEYVRIDNLRCYPTGSNNEHETQYKEAA